MHHSVARETRSLKNWATSRNTGYQSRFVQRSMRRVSSILRREVHIYTCTNVNFEFSSSLFPLPFSRFVSHFGRGEKKMFRLGENLIQSLSIKIARCFIIISFRDLTGGTRFVETRFPHLTSGNAECKESPSGAGDRALYSPRG